MPDLEAKIAGWRARLHGELPDQGETVRELEDHLRDDIATLQRAGLATDAAFEQAAKRLGDTRAIAREFSRVRSPWLPRSRSARVVLVLLAAMLIAIIFLITTSYSAGTMTLLFATHIFATSTGYLTNFSTGMIAVCALVIAWRRPLAERERRDLRQVIFRLTAISSACQSLGILLGMFWAANNLGRSWAWAPVETGAAFVLFSTGLLLLVQLRLKLADRVRYVLVILGATVLFASLAAGAVTPAVPIAWLGVAFAVSQIAVLMLRSTAERIVVPAPEQPSVQ